MNNSQTKKVHLVVSEQNRVKRYAFSPVSVFFSPESGQVKELLEPACVHESSKAGQVKQKNGAGCPNLKEVGKTEHAKQIHRAQFKNRCTLHHYVCPLHDQRTARWRN